MPKEGKHMFGTIDFTWTPPEWLHRLDRIKVQAAKVVWALDDAVSVTVRRQFINATVLTEEQATHAQRILHVAGLETGKTVIAARRGALAVTCQWLANMAPGTNSEAVQNATYALVGSMLTSYDERMAWLLDYRADPCGGGWRLILDGLSLTPTSRYWLAYTEGSSEAPVHMPEDGPQAVEDGFTEDILNRYGQRVEEKEEEEMDGMEFVSRGYLKDGEVHDYHDAPEYPLDPVVEPDPDDYGYVDQDGKVAHTDGGGCSCLACEHIRAERSAHAERYLAVEKDVHEDLKS